MTTKHYNRPDTASPEGGETGLTNRTKYQDISATVPKIPISSEDADSELNYLINAVNELFDTAISGTVPDNSVTLAKLSHLGNGSVYIMSATGVPTELTIGSTGDVLTVASGVPSWATPQGVPTGTILEWGGSSLPAGGYIWADGTDANRTTYSDLFAVYSTTHGVGDGSTTFGIPDRRGRAGVGKDDMGGASANILTDANADVLGGELGTETHTLTTSEIPAHTHNIDTYTASNSNGTANTALESVTADNSMSTGSTGGGDAHTIVQPSLAMNYIIKT